ncbi:MAG: alpha-amylase [Candidatus Pacebacteria bacterium]|nr:alpha-amylase [Candidatus Paceibacterota bacterium]
MPQICFYFQLHQPYRLSDFNVFDLSNDTDYFSKDNKTIFQKVSAKSYRPMLSLLLKLVNRHKEFKFALSCSGVFLEQALEFDDEVIKLIQKLVKTGQVELLAETYYHSLAGLYSQSEFNLQVKKHNDLIKELFNYQPVIFRNSELIYNNYIAEQVETMGYKAILTEAVDRYLYGRDRTKPYLSYTKKPLPLLLKHAPLSDDIAFRFSDKNWPEHPLTVEKYIKWVEIYPEDHIVNLFMDFETFGEHQWEDTGIFLFFEKFIDEFITKSYNKFVTPREVVSKLDKNKLEVYDVPEPISWADVDRDLTAWVDNDLQKDMINKIYELENLVLKTANDQLIEKWRRLQTSDNFYYMCTKWSNDGDVHAYFSPFETPFEAYRHYSIVLADLIIKIDSENQLEQLVAK